MSLRDAVLNDFHEEMLDRSSSVRAEIFLDFNHRFFTPTKKFFAALEPHKGLNFVDCGTGVGLVPHEMRAEGFKCVGIDVSERAGQQPDVVKMDARYFPFAPDRVCLICRPSHDGFALSTARRALQQGAYVMYAGLRRNFETDMGPIRNYLRSRHVHVGKEGENLYVFKRD